MNTDARPIWDRFRENRIFWIIVGVILLLFVALQWNMLLGLLISVVGLLIAITVHECAHAWVADRLNDPTARHLGRVSLNPLVHLDAMGTIMILVTAVTGLGIGWGKPVPVSPHRLKYGPKKGGMLVALAGPLANLLVALVFGLLLRLVGGRLLSLWWLYVILQAVVSTNIIIAMFNLLPFPPLDGHSVLLGLLSFVEQQWAWRVSQFIESWARQGALILFGVIILSQLLGLNLIGALIVPPWRFLYHLFVG